MVVEEESSRIARRWLVAAAAVAGFALAAGFALTASGAHAAAGPPFEPEQIQRITLPPQVTDASTPVFTRDGHHLLFFSGLHLWIVSEHGRDPHCLSCGLASQPTLSPSEQEGFATEFPDRRRVFFGAANSVAVLECRPSVIDCRRRRILPVSLAGARPGGAIVPPGGVDASPAFDEGGGASPKLSPDGRFVAFSDVRTDVAELMVIARLKRTATGYVTSDPRVLNPPAPTSPTDTNTRAWSDSTGLFEFKTFADGGADATYAQVGGDALGNPDVWKLNLRTGRRTRLTSYPDWDEDNAPSPNGRSIVIESDRGMHRVDMLGALMPVRDFIDDPEVAALASYYVGAGGPQPLGLRRQCDLQPWLLPASGDRGGSLMGQPLQPYTGGTVHPANNVSGYPQWAPNGTAIALNTESYTTNRSAPYLLVAHLSSRRPSRPDRIVSSQPGHWAPSPDDYHGPIGSINHVVLQGLRAGTVTVNYDNSSGLLAGSDSETYSHYSDNGRDFVNGTYTITNSNLLTGSVRIDGDLTMTGADTGYIRVHAAFSGVDVVPASVTGTATDNYDGTTRSGIPHVPRACPRALPRPPRMHVTGRFSDRLGRRKIVVHVTASVADAGPNEAGVDTRPVIDATVRIGRVHARTSATGIATLPVGRDADAKVTIHATAGDALEPATTRLAPARR